MSHSRQYYSSSRPQPQKQDSWITIDWGKQWPQDRSQKPSKMHGFLDQITGRLVGDERLKQQGRKEWAKAREYSARRKAAGGGGFLARLFLGKSSSPSGGARVSHSTSRSSSSRPQPSRHTSQRQHQSSSSRPSAGRHTSTRREESDRYRRTDDRHRSQRSTRR